MANQSPIGQYSLNFQDSTSLKPLTSIIEINNERKRQVDDLMKTGVIHTLSSLKSRFLERYVLSWGSETLSNPNLLLSLFYASSLTDPILSKTVRKVLKNKVGHNLSSKIERIIDEIDYFVHLPKKKFQ